MKVAGLDRIDEFVKVRHQAKTPLDNWVKLLKKCSFKNPEELRRTVGSVDYYHKAVIFDIGGNKYRVIAKIEYLAQIVIIKHVLTHEEYEKDKWKKELE